MVLIAKLARKTMKKFARKKVGMKRCFVISGLIVLLLILCSNILVIALFAISLFTVVGIAGIIILLKHAMKFLER